MGWEESLREPPVARRDPRDEIPTSSLVPATPGLWSAGREGKGRPISREKGAGLSRRENRERTRGLDADLLLSRSSHWDIPELLLARSSLFFPLGFLVIPWNGAAQPLQELHPEGMSRKQRKSRDFCVPASILDGFRALPLSQMPFSGFPTPGFFPWH